MLRAPRGGALFVCGSGGVGTDPLARGAACAKMELNVAPTGRLSEALPLSLPLELKRGILCGKPKCRVDVPPRALLPTS